MLSCAGGNVLVGTCGSGWRADCSGSFHHEMCTSSMKYSSDNVQTQSGKYGEWKYCGNGAITGICRSGRYGDCNKNWL